MASKWQNIMNRKWYKRIGGTLLAATAFSGLAVSLAVTPAFATDLVMHPPKYPWYHKSMWHSFDHSSLRRGYQVYREVCSACHGIKGVCYRHLIDVCITKDEAKAIAAEHTYTDGPNDDGQMFERPGKPTDNIKSPYPNEQAARKANNGSLPPDLSLLILSKHGTEDYVFQILTGYCDPPTGRTISEGQYYNPYFLGGAIGMARALYNEMIEFEDGTPATTSQMAKDVTTFLSWCSDPYHDLRKRWLIKAMLVSVGLIGLTYYMKVSKWSYVKTMKFAYKNRKAPKDI